MARFYQGDAVCECGKDVPVFKTGGGMLTSSCGWCRRQVHCPEGSSSFRRMNEKIKMGINPDEEPKKVTVKAAVEVAPIKKVAEAIKAADVKEPEKTIFDIFS